MHMQIIFKRNKMNKQFETIEEMLDFKNAFSGNVTFIKPFDYGEVYKSVREFGGVDIITHRQCLIQINESPISTVPMYALVLNCKTMNVYKTLPQAIRWVKNYLSNNSDFIEEVNGEEVSNE